MTRSLVEQVRVRYPQDGSRIEGRNVVVTGTGNPGHSILLQLTGQPDQTAEVAADHTWVMSEIKLVSGDHSVFVTDTTADQRSPEVGFTLESLRPITVVSPLDGETMEARKIELTGKASPGKLVSLRLPGLKTAVERASERGSFRFSGVVFSSWGAQRLVIFYAENPGEGSAEITLDWPGLDLPSVVDPVTREPLKPGSDVVRCASCYTYCYRATWQRMGTCPRCAKGTEFWDRRDAVFKLPRVQIGGQTGSPAGPQGSRRQ